MPKNTEWQKQISKKHAPPPEKKVFFLYDPHRKSSLFQNWTAS